MDKTRQGTDEMKQVGVLERLQGIAEALTEAVAVAGKIVGCVPSNVQDMKQGTDCAMAYIDDMLNTISDQTHYLQERLAEIQRRL